MLPLQQAVSRTLMPLSYHEHRGNMGLQAAVVMLRISRGACPHSLVRIVYGYKLHEAKHMGRLLKSNEILHLWDPPQLVPQGLASPLSAFAVEYHIGRNTSTKLEHGFAKSRRCRTTLFSCAAQAGICVGLLAASCLAKGWLTYLLG